MADEDQHQPDRRDLLNERTVKLAADFNREMQVLSWPYRLQQTITGGVWTLTDTRSSTLLHRTPPVDETIAVHIARAWLYGNLHGGSFEIVGQYLIGLLPDDASPY